MMIHHDEDPGKSPIKLAELLCRHIDAMGGTDALAGIETLECMGTLKVQVTGCGPGAGPLLTSSGTSRRVLMPAKSIYACDEWGMARDEWGWNGAIAWRRNSQEKLRRLQGDEEAFVKLEAALVSLANLPSEMLRREPDESVEEAGESCFAVGIYGSGGQLDAKVLLAGEHSKHAYLCIARTMDKGLPFHGPGPTRIHILDYQAVAGVKVPRRVRAVSDPVCVEWDYTAFAVNEAVDEALFEPPGPIIQYTRLYRDLIQKLLEEELTPDEFGNRFNELFKWEPAGFPCPEYDALEDLRESLAEFLHAENNGRRPNALLKRLMKSARKALRMLERSA